MAGDIFVAVESVLTEVDGQNVYITAGQTAEAGAAILQGREHLFEPFEVDYKVGEPMPGAVVAPAPEEEADEEAAEEPVEDDGLPKGNASREEWAAYALAHGLTEDEVGPLTRDEIRDRFAPA
jgi:hypothetical protein